MCSPVPQAVLGTASLILLATLAYVVHRYFNRAMDRSPSAVYRMRAHGALLLGAIPLGLTVALTDLGTDALGLGRGNPGAAVRVLGPFVPIILFVVIRGARKAVARDEAPSILQPSWTPRDRILNAATWLVYLTGYELLFRGILLLGLVPALGASAALGVSTGLYVLAHLHKSAGETLGSMPVGILMAVATLQSGSIWGAVVLHTLIAVVQDERARAVAGGLAMGPRRT